MRRIRVSTCLTQFRTASMLQTQPKVKQVPMTVDAALAMPASMQVIHQLFYFLDQSKYEGLVALFTPNGTLFRQGELLTGREQIMQAMLKRSVTQRTRHVISNGFIESQSRDLVDLVAYMTAYRFDDGTMHTGLVKITQPLRLSLVRATMQQTDGAWRVASMIFIPEFEYMSGAA